MPSRHMRNYPSNWKKVSRLLRTLADGRCQNCGNLRENLSVHHIGVAYPDGCPGDPRDKHDLRRENLMVICFTCHDGLENIRKRRASRQKQQAKRRAKLEQHRALGIGTGLVLCNVAYL